MTPTASTSGFTLDLSNVQAGNTVNLSYTNSAGVQQQVQIVAVDDPKALPLPSQPGANPQVIGIDFSGATASVASQLNTALGQAGLSFSNPSGNTLQVVTSSASDVTIKSASTTTTVTSLTSGSAQLPLFTDSGSPYTGAITSSGSEMTGLASRIEVNPALLANPANLTTYSTNPPTPAGDNTRSDFIYSQLTSSSFTYSPKTGLGSTTAPFTGTITSYLQQFVSQQAAAATLCDAVAAGPERRRQHVAAKIQFDLGGQHRQRAVEPDRFAEFVFCQCSRDVGHSKHDADLDAGSIVRRVSNGD